MARSSISAAIAAILAPSAFLISAPAVAQSPEPASAPAAQVPEEPPEIVVTGFRQSYIDALNTKRVSAQITDSIRAMARSPG